MPVPFPKKISQIKPVLTNVDTTSHYEVQFGLPPTGGLLKHLRYRGVNNRYITENIGLLCCNAALPGSSFGTAEINGNYTGLSEKMVHTRIFTQIDLEFYVENSYKSMKFIEHWMEFISSGSTTGEGSRNYSALNREYFYRMHYPVSYKSDETRIIKFNRDYKSYIEWRFFGLFPMSLNSTSVSYQGSQILKASASFNYDRYVCGKSRSIDVFKFENENKDPVNKPGGSTPNENPRTTTGTIPNRARTNDSEVGVLNEGAGGLRSGQRLDVADSTVRGYGTVGPSFRKY